MNENISWTDEAYQAARQNAKTEWEALQPILKQRDEAKWRGEATFSDYLLDVPRGVVSGAEGAVKSMGKLADDLTESFGGDLADDELFQTDTKTRTFVGSLTDGLVQFGVSMIPLAGPVSTITKGYQLSRKAALGVNMGTAAVADFAAFDETEGRLSNLLIEFPALNNPVTRYLAADGDDHWAEGRLKSVLEGLGVGVLTDLFVPALRGFKKMKGAKDAADPKLFEQARKETEELVLHSAKVEEYRTQIKAAAPGITEEQTNEAFILWGTVAKQQGIDFAEFLEKRLIGFKSGDDAFGRLDLEPSLLQTARRESLPDDLRTKTNNEITEWSQDHGYDVSAFKDMGRDRKIAELERQAKAGVGQREQVGPILRTEKEAQDAALTYGGTPRQVYPHFVVLDGERVIGTYRNRTEAESVAQNYGATVKLDGRYQLIDPELPTTAAPTPQATKPSSPLPLEEVPVRPGGPDPIPLADPNAAPSIPLEPLSQARRQEIIGEVEAYGLKTINGKPLAMAPDDTLSKALAKVQANEKFVAQKARLTPKPPEAGQPLQLKDEAKPDPSLSDIEVPASMSTPPVNRLKVDGPSIANITAKADVKQLPVFRDLQPDTRPPETKGAVDFLNDSKAVVYLFKSADFSTLVHELSHVYRRFGLEGELKSQVESLLGVRQGQWDVAAEEKFARLFERWLRDGVSPNDAFIPAFTKYKGWMEDIYKSVTDSPLSEDVSPQVRDAFERMLGQQAPIKDLDAVPLPTKPGDQGIMQESNMLLQRDGVPPEVNARFASDLKRHIASGRDFDDAVDAAFRTNLNTDRMDVDGQVKSLAANLHSALDTTIQKRVGGVLGLEEVLERANEAAKEFGLEGALAASSKDAAKSREMAVNLVSYRVVQVSKLEEMRGLILKARDGNTQAAKSLEDMVGDVARLHLNIGEISTNLARGPSYGRVVASSVDLKLQPLVDALKTAVRGGYGDNAKDKLLTALMASAEDPSIVRNILGWFDGAGKTGFQKVLDAHLELWINSLLSGLRTQATNIISGLSQTLLMPAERWIGGLLTGNRPAQESAARIYSGLVHAGLDIFNLSKLGSEMSEASGGGILGMMKKSLMEERSILDDITKATEGNNRFAITASNFGLDKTNPLGRTVDFLGKVVRGPSRLLTSADELWKQHNYRAALYDIAYQSGLEQKFSNPKDFASYVTEFMRAGYDVSGKATNEAALQWARRATFTEELLPGTWGRTLQDVGNRHPVFRLFAPFIRTPTNLLKTAWHYTPGLNFLNSEFRQKLLSGDELVRADAVGRLAVGGVFWGTAVGLAVSGRITGGGPSDPEQRALLQQTGWQAYSIVLEKPDGSRDYLSFARLDPYSTLLGLAADYAELAGQMEDEDALSTAQAMTVALAKNVSSKTWLTGLSEITSVLTSPDRSARRWWINRVSSYVPNILGSMNDDPHLREARTVLDAVKRKIPGYSQEVAPKRNLLGEPIPVAMGYAPWGEGDVSRAMSPVAFSRRVGGVVKEGLAKLQVGIGPPSRMLNGIDLTQLKNERGQNAFDRYQQLVGEVKSNGQTMSEALEALFNSAWYKNQPDPETPDDRTNEKVMSVLRIISDYRDASRNQLFQEFKQIGEVSRRARSMQREKRSPALQRLLNN